MGSICSNCFGGADDKTDPTSVNADVDPNERSRLINPVSNSSVNRLSGDLYPGNSYQSTNKGDEHSALSRILHQTANNVIDVSAIDAHNLEKQEYMDRVKHYRTRVEVICSSSQVPRRREALPNSGILPQTSLVAPPVSLSDVQLINQTADRMAQSVKQIKVSHKEELVVPFGVP